MIEVEHLFKKYGDLLAVQDLSFSVEKGHIWGLLGPNAAGKTTTMRILTGYLPATDTEIHHSGNLVIEVAIKYENTVFSGWEIFKQVSVDIIQPSSGYKKLQPEVMLLNGIFTH